MRAGFHQGIQTEWSGAKIGFYPRAGNATKDSVVFLNKDRRD